MKPPPDKRRPWRRAGSMGVVPVSGVPGQSRVACRVRQLKEYRRLSHNRAQPGAVPLGVPPADGRIPQRQLRVSPSASTQGQGRRWFMAGK